MKLIIREEATRVFKIPVYWTALATMEVRARDLDSAIEELDNMPLPDDWEYSDGSFDYDYQLAEEWNGIRK